MMPDALLHSTSGDPLSVQIGFFEFTRCSNCGRDFGAGPSGFSHCHNHTASVLAERREAARQWRADGNEWRPQE